MASQEQLFSIALTRLSSVSIKELHEIYLHFGSAEKVMENRGDLRSELPNLSPRAEKALQDTSEALRKAEAELSWCEKNKVEAIPLNSPLYPQRLSPCPDAPIVLYFKGNGNMNYKKVVSIVGTRRSTIYGSDILRHFMEDLKGFADVLVVSGLAYGIDVTAHREALKQGFATIAVLAHGQDTLYPTSHRTTAEEMLNNGGLVTEYPIQTFIGKTNFVQRNRIVAGLSDCTIVVESAEKGGGLITANIAQSYNRDVFAFPGAVNSPSSRGCNNLIRDNKAALINNAEDFVKAMGWDDEQELSEAKDKGIALNLFNDLTDEEKAIVEVLQKTNDLQVNILTVQAGLPINKTLSVLFNLEMKGVVKALAGGAYHLL